MNTKQWMQFYARLTPVDCREMAALLLRLADGGVRNAAREADVQDAIALMPDDNLQILTEEKPT